MMSDSGPFASASRSTDGQMTEAAARILTHSDASWVMLLRSAGDTNYSQQRTHAYDTISAWKEHGHCWTSSCAIAVSPAAAAAGCGRATSAAAAATSAASPMASVGVLGEGSPLVLSLGCEVASFVMAVE